MGSRRDLPVLDRLQREANAVTGEVRGHQFEIQLGHLCNNRCVFCSSGQLSARKIARPIPLAPIVEAIERARAAGARRVTFLGGEPTIHKGFLDALTRAVDLGFEEIVIFTNGVMFPHADFIDRVLAFGAPVEWRVSIQGGNEAAHVDVTGRPDSFRRIIAGLETLRARGQRVTANACINARSYRSLPDYPALALAHGLAQLHLDVVRPDSMGDHDADDLRAVMPRYAEMAPAFRAMLETFTRELPDFDVNIGNLPYCALPEWSDRIHHGGEETVTQSCEEGGLGVAVDKYDWHFSQRTHPPGCAGCVFRPLCSGVYREYLALYGDDEFRAVSPDDLRARDPSRRAFVLLLAPWLDGLTEDLRARGWTPRDEHRDARLRVVTLDLAATRGGRATLRLVPPDAPGRYDARTDDYALDLDLDPETDPDARDALLDVLAARGAPLDRDALAARRALARAARRARGIADALRAMGPARGWSAGDVREEDGATVLPLRDGGGARVEVVLLRAAHGDRGSVSVDFRLTAGTPLERARPLVQRVIRALDERTRTAHAAVPIR